MESKLKSLSTEKEYSKNNFFLTKFNVLCYGCSICFPLLFLRPLHNFPMSLSNWKLGFYAFYDYTVIDWSVIGCFMWLESVRMMRLILGNNWSENGLNQLIPLVPFCGFASKMSACVTCNSLFFFFFPFRHWTWVNGVNFFSDFVEVN